MSFFIYRHVLAVNRHINSRVLSVVQEVVDKNPTTLTELFDILYQVQRPSDTMETNPPAANINFHDSTITTIQMYVKTMMTISLIQF